jgi:hypothetical protein
MVRSFATRLTMILIVVISELLAQPPKKESVVLINGKIVIPGGQIDSIQVDAQIDAHNPTAVTVVVDLSRLSSLEVIERLTVPVQFFDAKGKLITIRKYNFTDKTVPRLFGGRKYKRSFEYSVKSFNVAKGVLKPLPAEGVIMSDIQASRTPNDEDPWPS